MQGRGLGYLRADWRQQVQFQGTEDGLHGAMYRALGKAGDGGIWLGDMGGMIEHMDAQGRIAMLDPASLDQLHNIKPVVITEDRQRRLWLGHRGGLVRISRNGGVEQWASDELRSVNAQIEYVLRDALRRAGRLKPADIQNEDEDANR